MLIKNLAYFFFSAVLLTSCNKDEGQPEYIPLKIVYQFEAKIVPLNLSELEDFSSTPHKFYIVNSENDIPENPLIGSADLKAAGINFSQESLLINYTLLLGEINSYQYKWLYDNWFEQYEFCIIYEKIPDSEYIDGEIERVSYIRNAIVVDKIPEDARCVTSEN